MASEDTKLAGMRSETQLEATLTHHNRVLLNTLDSQQQRIAELEQALRALLADDGAAFKERDCCYFCDAVLFAEAHREDCPVLAARKLLES